MKIVKYIYNDVFLKRCILKQYILYVDGKIPHFKLSGFTVFSAGKTAIFLILFS